MWPVSACSTCGEAGLRAKVEKRINAWAAQLNADRTTLTTRPIRVTPNT